MRDLTRYIESLHVWNVENQYRGYDPYTAREKFNYAEADAYWGNGVLALERIGDAVNYADSLLKSQKGPGTWGLPWEWAGNSVDQPYTDTSILAAGFLKDLSHFEERYAKTVFATCEWLVKTAYRKGTIIYCPGGKLDFPVTNTVSLAGGLLSKCSGDIDLDTRILDELAEYVCSRQLSNGLWNYTDFNPIIDNYHNILTLKGLIDMYGHGPAVVKEKVKPIIDKGMDSYIKMLIDKRNAPKRMYPNTPKSRLAHMFHDILGSNIAVMEQVMKLPKLEGSAVTGFYEYVKCTGTEANLWDYSYAIDLFNDHMTTFGRNERYTSIRDTLLTLATDGLWDDDAFRFCAHVSDKFIRPNAKMFESMAGIKAMS
jgi:hypothetical protein